MECKECFKQLNKMTIFCDRCGAQLTKDKIEVNVNLLEKLVAPIKIENPYVRDHNKEIRNALFLSNIRKDFKGRKLRYVDQIIDYTLLRNYYEKNKRFLLTKDFSRNKAYEIFKAFTEKKMNKVTIKILEEEFPDDYKEKRIPLSIINNVDKVYIPEFNLKNLGSNKLLFKTLSIIFKRIFRTAIFIGVLGAIAYGALTVFDPSGGYLDMIINIPFIIEGVIVLVVLRGILKGIKLSKFIPFTDAINSNPVFKKYLANDGKKKMKTIKYRMKKGRG
jgi:hypothetical protein